MSSLISVPPRSSSTRRSAKSWIIIETMTQLWRRGLRPRPDEPINQNLCPTQWECSSPQKHSRRSSTRISFWHMERPISARIRRTSTTRTHLVEQRKASTGRSRLGSLACTLSICTCLRTELGTGGLILQIKRAEHTCTSTSRLRKNLPTK